MMCQEKEYSGQRWGPLNSCFLKVKSLDQQNQPQQELARNAEAWAVLPAQYNRDVYL